MKWALFRQTQNFEMFLDRRLFERPDCSSRRPLNRLVQGALDAGGHGGRITQGDEIAELPIL